MNLNKIINAIEKIAPLDLADEWDNSGIQIDAGKKEIKKVLVALEITKPVIDEAKEVDIDLIITHHPLFFKPVLNIDGNTVIGNYVVELILSGISVYSAHTNFDAADGGNNDYIASLLKLSNVRKFNETSLGRVGELLMKMSFDEVCGYVKDLLLLPRIITVVNPTAKIGKVGVCCGAGGYMIDEAIEVGCDLYITGDIKYHDAQNAFAREICLIDAGHYGTEKFFAENLTKQLMTATQGEIEIISTKQNIDPFSVL